jgi:hypothetical protein
MGTSLKECHGNGNDNSFCPDNDSVIVVTPSTFDQLIEISRVTLTPRIDDSDTKNTHR